MYLMFHEQLQCAAKVENFGGQRHLCWHHYFAKDSILCLILLSIYSSKRKEKILLKDPSHMGSPYPVWPHHNLAYCICNDPIPNKFIFWGTGDEDFSIWIFGGHNSTVTISYSGKTWLCLSQWNWPWIVLPDGNDQCRNSVSLVRGGSHYQYIKTWAISDFF